MSDYAARLSQHRRLVILKFLNKSPEYTSNASILEGVCNDYGVNSTRDQVLGDVSWMAENGLVNREATGDVVVVTATARGVDVAEGKSRVDGVQRPRPGT